MLRNSNDVCSLIIMVILVNKLAELVLVILFFNQWSFFLKSTTLLEELLKIFKVEEINIHEKREKL